MAVDDFPLDELALQVGGHEIHAANAAAALRGVGEESSRRAVLEGGSEGLVVVDAPLERAALHAESGFRGTISLDLVDPHELVDTTSGGELVDADACPRRVVDVIVELLVLRARPRLPHLGSLLVVLGGSGRVGPEGSEQGQVVENRSGLCRRGRQEHALDVRPRDLECLS